MNITLHIPVEQYGFVAVEINDTVDPEEIAEKYREISAAFKPKPVNEMPKKEFREILDLVIQGKPLQHDPGILNEMSPSQREILREVNKSIKRINE